MRKAACDLIRRDRRARFIPKMNDPHITCEKLSILTRACRKPAPVAFAYIVSLADQLLMPNRWKRVLRGRMKRWVLAGALAFAAAGHTLASDLPPPGAPPAPPRAPAAYVPAITPVYNWGGIYFGFNLGYGFGISNWTDPNNFSGLGSTGCFNLTGFLVGPTVGANFQTDGFVYGVEADFDGSWIDGKKSSAFCGNVGFGPSAQCETKNFWFAIARARLGYAVDRVLFYGTGGGALGNVSSEINGSFQ